MYRLAKALKRKGQAYRRPHKTHHAKLSDKQHVPKVNVCGVFPCTSVFFVFYTHT